MTATDKKDNVITLGDIGIELVEDGWEEVTDTTSPYYEKYVRGDGMSFNTVPGDIVAKAPYVVNTDVNDVWAYLIVQVPTLTANEFSNTATYLDKYGSKYDINVTALGVQDGLFKDENGNNISTVSGVWDTYFGETASFFTEAPATTQRKEFIKFVGLDETNWTEMMVFHGVNSNFYVYGYNTVISGSDTLAKEMRTLNETEDNDRISEINEMFDNGKYGQTTELFTGVTLHELFGSEIGSGLAAKPLGGCLFYIDEREFTFTDESGVQHTIAAGCDIDGRPYRYTFYDENGNELSNLDVELGSHAISKYKIELPQYYEDALDAGTITPAEYRALPKTPIFDKYYIVAAEDNETKTSFSLIYGNSNTAAATSVKQTSRWSATEDPASMASYPLDNHLKTFLKNNNLVDKYYTVSGDNWTLSENAVDNNNLIGMGKYNTKFIYEFFGTSNANYFASDCLWGQLEIFNNDTAGQRNHTGCYDWYIPSKDEITAIQSTRYSLLNNFNVGNVWTSSEHNYRQVWFTEKGELVNACRNIYGLNSAYKPCKTYAREDRSLTVNCIFVRSF